MAIQLISPITGLPVTGMAGATYHVVPDLAPVANSKQWAVSKLGGTQPGVVANSVANPFTITFYRPTQISSVKRFDPNGRPIDVVKNTYSVIIRKGATLSQLSAPRVNEIQIKIPVFAGTETFAPNDIKAMLSFGFAALLSQVDELCNLIETGTM